MVEENQEQYWMLGFLGFLGFSGITGFTNHDPWQLYYSVNLDFWIF